MGRITRTLLLAIAVLALLASPRSRIAAQVVRGTVTQGTSGAPVAGALIELLVADSGGNRVASGLTDVAGAFALRAPGPGRYTVSAKRIGVRRVTTPPFTLAAGESRTIPITLEAVEYRLPEVVVTANALCSVNPNEEARVNALWDEARTALDAAEISLRDKLFTAQVSRYVRELEPKTLRVLNETRSEVRGAVASPFASPPPESLSAAGYWRVAPDGGALYHAPDARVLLSDAFLGDHCFHPVTGHGTRQGLVGLAFAPVIHRPVADVVGTVWLDATSLELRLVDFAYDRARQGVDSAAVGGELHFARLASGAWIVRRWFLRVPVQGRSAQPLTTEGSAPWILIRPSSARLSEEGGVVTTDELRPATRPATITGIARDSTGKRPLRGAIVRLNGSARTVTPDSAGRFRFDDVTPGGYTVTVTTAGYDTLGISAAARATGPGDGESVRMTITALDTRGITMQLCGGRAAPWGRGTLHVTARDSVTGAPVSGVRATLSWMSTIGQAHGDSVPAETHASSDAHGNLTFCDVPSDRTLILRVDPRPGASAELLRTMIRAREVRHVEVRVAPRPT